MPRQAPMWLAPWSCLFWRCSRASGSDASSMPELRTIVDDDDGIRLDRWFRRHYPTLTHARLEKLLRKGEVRLDGKRAKSADRVVAGPNLCLPPPGDSDKGGTPAQNQ